jgi:hypothetical protein
LRWSFRLKTKVGLPLYLSFPLLGTCISTIALLRVHSFARAYHGLIALVCFASAGWELGHVGAHAKTLRLLGRMHVGEDTRALEALAFAERVAGCEVDFFSASWVASSVPSERVSSLEANTLSDAHCVFYNVKYAATDIETRLTKAGFAACTSIAHDAYRVCERNQ